MTRREDSSPVRSGAREAARSRSDTALWSAIRAERRVGDAPGARLRAMLLAQIDDGRR